MSILALGERDVHELLPMRDCIDLMHDTFAGLGRFGFVQPLRNIAWQPDRNGAIAVMPAWLGQPHALGAKIITVFPQNRQAGLESHQGFVALFDTSHGEPIALLHAGAITAIRTAAVSAAATRLLARSGWDKLAILGSGVQAQSHLEAMATLTPLQHVRIWSRTFEHARTFAQRARAQYGVETSAETQPQKAVSGADVVCTVTAATAPVLLGEWLRAGQHVNAVGSSVPPFRELDSGAVLKSRLFVDSRESAVREPDDILVPLRDGVITEDHIAGELAQLAAGTITGRTSDADITLFKSVGLALEDLAAARFVYERALAQGRGTTLNF